MKKIFYLCSVLLLTFATSCTDADSEPVTAADPEAVISQDDALYHLVERAVNTNPDSLLTCVTFVYPIEVVLYNSNNEQVATHSIPDDAFFYAFLDNLDEGLSLTLSYPVGIASATGTTNITSNETLLSILQGCAQAQQIAWAENIFAPAETNCIWQVGHSAYWLGNSAAYTGGYFTPEPDGPLTFTYDGESYSGTWEITYEENGLMLHINLEGGDTVTEYWNNSYPLGFSGEDSIYVESTLGSRVLTHQCETTENYTIGQEGPAGGIVFYDKGEYSEGWRYIEVATTERDTLVQWGCDNITLGTTSAAVGKGLINSGKIKTFFDSLPGYYTNPVETCSDNADGTVAAGLALYINNGNEQWFLPSKDELQLVYQNLAAEGLGNFGQYYYWTSTEVDSANAWAVHFGAEGEAVALPKYEVENVRVRAVHYF